MNFKEKDDKDIEGEDIIENQYIKLSDLRKVTGIGDKTIERIKDMIREEQNDIYKSEYDENIKLDINNIYRGDCLELMNGISDGSIDMILCDLPYGVTQCKWDSIIPFDNLWLQYERIIKDSGIIILTASQPFTSALVMSNPNLFKYELIWEKEQGTGQLNAKKMPLKKHESILVFSKNKLGNFTYNPQMGKGKPYSRNDIGKVNNIKEKVYGNSIGYKASNITTRHPTSIVQFNMVKEKGQHPTQKPVDLFEYLIKTYTNEGDLVLDNCIGSGTTAISAINTNRNFIGIELQDEYYKLAKDRVNKHIIDHNLQEKYSELA